MAKNTSNLTKHSTWSGIAIFIDEDGYFSAKVEDIEFREPRLEGLRLKIDHALKPEARKVKMALPVLILDSEREKFVETKLTGASRNNRELQFDPPLSGRFSRHNTHVIADTPENRKRLSAMIAANKAWNAADEAIKKRKIEVHGYGRIEIEQYPGVAKDLTDQHKKSAR